MTREELARLGPEARKQVAQYMDQVKTGKYRNQRTKVDGITFDSQKEARRFIELKFLLQAGRIRNLKLQPQFTIQEAYTTPEGERVCAVRYVADFSYDRPTYPDQNGYIHWVKVVEDVKSKATKTAQYEIKRKLMLERFGIAVEEV